ncbi:MAG: FkbM family methyltransferase [Thiohalocapsa sp.]
MTILRRRQANARLRRAEVVAGFELLLRRSPAGEAEIAAALRLGSLPELVDHLLATDEFRRRYEALVPPKPASEPASAAPAADTRPPALFLGDRVLCWTHHGMRLYLLPQDIDLTPRILASGDWENHVEQTMRRLLRPGNTVIDLGANVGYHTLNFCDAAGPHGRVFAFEPHPEVMRLLAATIFINHFEDRAELHCLAVADTPGTLALALSPDHFGSGNLVPAGASRLYDDSYPIRLTVPAVTLDALLGERVAAVDLLHMDIEGAEPQALRGAAALIERSPSLKIVTEWSLGIMQAHAVDIPAYIAWLQQRGFRFWHIDSATANLEPLAASQLLDLPHSDLLLSRQDPD